MLLKNAVVLTEDFKFEKLDVQISGSEITAIGNNTSDSEVMDLCGSFIIPGLVDIHTHGAVGTDTMDTDFNFCYRNNTYLFVFR